MGPQPLSQTVVTMAAKSPVANDVSIAELRESVEVAPRRPVVRPLTTPVRRSVLWCLGFAVSFNDISGWSGQGLARRERAHELGRISGGSAQRSCNRAFDPARLAQKVARHLSTRFGVQRRDHGPGRAAQAARSRGREPPWIGERWASPGAAASRAGQGRPPLRGDLESPRGGGATGGFRITQLITSFEC